MRIMTSFLSILLTFNSIHASAQTNPNTSSTSLSAKEYLTAQYAELEDLQEQLKNADRLKTVGWVGIVVSSTALSLSLFTYLVESSVGLGAQIISGFFGKGTPPAPIEISNKTIFLFYGGLAGEVIGASVVYIEHSKIKMLSEKIDSIQKEIRKKIDTMK